MEHRGVLPITQFAYWNGLFASDALLCVSLSLQSASESGQETRIEQTDFSTSFDRDNNQGIIYKLCSVVIGGPMLSILAPILSIIIVAPIVSQHVIVDGYWSKLVNVLSVVPQRSVLGLLLFFLYTSELFFSFWKIS